MRLKMRKNLGEQRWVLVIGDQEREELEVVYFRDLSEMLRWRGREEFTQLLGTGLFTVASMPESYYVHNYTKETTKWWKTLKQTLFN
jgi:hypothetical protein